MNSRPMAGATHTTCPKERRPIVCYGSYSSYSAERCRSGHASGQARNSQRWETITVIPVSDHPKRRAVKVNYRLAFEFAREFSLRASSQTPTLILRVMVGAHSLCLMTD